jgi:hypothetical protein
MTLRRPTLFRCGVYLSATTPGFYVSALDSLSSIVLRPSGKDGSNVDTLRVYHRPDADATNADDPDSTTNPNSQRSLRRPAAESEPEPEDARSEAESMSLLQAQLDQAALLKSEGSGGKSSATVTASPTEKVPPAGYSFDPKTAIQVEDLPGGCEIKAIMNMTIKNYEITY